MFDRKNLVVLMYASNTCYTTILEPGDPLVLKADVLIDEGKETWARPISGSENLKIIKIGDSHRCDYGAKWGAIGVYDRTNLNHLNSMVHAAREATRDRGSLIKDD